MSSTLPAVKDVEEIIIARAIERKKAEIVRINNIILMMAKAFEEKEKSRLGRIGAGLKLILGELKSKDTTSKHIKQQIIEVEKELSEVDIKEAKKFKGIIEEITRNEEENAFLSSILKNLEGDKRDEALGHLIENFDSYISKLEKEFKDRRTAGNMNKIEEKLSVRGRKKFLEEKRDIIEKWSEESDIKECIKVLQDLIANLGEKYKDEKLSAAFLRSDPIRKLLRYEKERDYMIRIYDKIDSEYKNKSSNWEFFEKFRKEGVIKKKITDKIFRKHFADHYTANRLEQMSHVTKITSWLNILNISFNELESGKPKENIITDAKQKLKNILDAVIPKLSLDSAESVHEIEVMLLKRIKNITYKRVPKELKEAIDKINDEWSRLNDEFISRSEYLLKLLDDNTALEEAPEIKDEIEVLRKTSDEINPQLDYQDKSFAFILNIFAAVKQKRDIPQNYVSALINAFAGLSGAGSTIKTIAENHNRAVEKLSRLDKAKLNLYEKIIKEFNRVFPELNNIIQRIGFDIAEAQNTKRLE